MATEKSNDSEMVAKQNRQPKMTIESVSHGMTKGRNWINMTYAFELVLRQDSKRKRKEGGDIN